MTHYAESTRVQPGFALGYNGSQASRAPLSEASRGFAPRVRKEGVMPAVSRSGRAVELDSALREMRQRVHQMLRRKITRGTYDDALVPGAFNMLAGALYRGKHAPAGLTEDAIRAELVQDFRASVGKS